MTTPPSRSWARLRERLAGIPGPWASYHTDPQYHATVHLLRTFLDVVDDNADPGTADRITDALVTIMEGDEARFATERRLRVRAQVDALQHAPVDPRFTLRGAGITAEYEPERRRRSFTNTSHGERLEPHHVDGTACDHSIHVTPVGATCEAGRPVTFDPEGPS